MKSATAWARRVWAIWWASRSRFRTRRGLLHRIPGMESDAYVFGHKGGGCPPFADTKTFEPGQKLTTYEVSCVVGEGDLVACKNTVTSHGFVLQPTGSWVF